MFSKLKTSATPRPGICRLGFAVLLALGFVAGCATSGPKTLKPGEGIAEYRKIATDATAGIRAAMDSLAAVSAQSNRCAPGVLASFSNVVQQLQVKSVQVRARTQAMEARGDAYFERWQENLAQVKDPAIRALAEKNHPALQEGFHRIKLLSQEGRESFAPFIAGLRKVRNELEKDPASVATGATRELLATAHQNGEHVQRCLANIMQELDAAKALITPSGRTAK
jgi:hypothetical protein